MIRNTLIIIPTAWIGISMPAVVSVMLLLAATSVGVLALALARTEQAHAS